MQQRLIFQLGTNNWQRQGEFAPGSGILHEAHHNAYNQIDGVTCYSIYPSKTQTSDDPQISIFRLTHDIPICESISPISNYRFHSMSETEFNAYVDRLQAFTADRIDAAEAAEGHPVDLAIAHHSFLNPLVLSRINRERAAAGRPEFKLLCFVHGTALKMFAHEKAGIDGDYPSRFLPFMQNEKVFVGDKNVHACAAISNEQLQKFADIFDEFPSDKMILSLNGYDTSIFKPESITGEGRAQFLAGLELAESPVAGAPKRIDSNPDKVVVFCGKFADWKRLDTVLGAAARWEQDANIATLVIGSGPDDAIAHYHKMAYEQLGLRNTWFLGPRPHADIARLNSAADIGVYPSRNEPFGLVLIECMACGTPVIGANSGGPRDFVTGDVGSLVKESEGAELVDAIYAEVSKALAEDWKGTKGLTAASYAADNFSVEGQCRRLLEDTGIIDAEKKLAV
ncbi:MAG: glycosyltransferase [Pseudomonadota bacterium]